MAKMTSPVKLFMPIGVYKGIQSFTHSQRRFAKSAAFIGTVHIYTARGEGLIVEARSDLMAVKYYVGPESYVYAGENDCEMNLDVIVPVVELSCESLDEQLEITLGQNEAVFCNKKTGRVWVVSYVNGAYKDEWEASFFKELDDAGPVGNSYRTIPSAFYSSSLLSAITALTDIQRAERNSHPTVAMSIRQNGSVVLVPEPGGYLGSRIKAVVLGW